MSGFTCKDCNRFIPHGATHTRLSMTKQCRTVTERGVECLHDWANADSAATLYGTQPTPTVPAGLNCAKCLQFVEHGATHRVFVAEEMCTTIPADGHVITHFWPVTKPGGKTHKAHGSHLSQTAVNNHRVDGWRILQRAATDLIGEPVTLESMKRVDSHDYVTVELIVRKDRA